jgi:hypothetical protein
MGIDNEAKRDVALGSKDAENVVGGAKKTIHKASHHTRAKAASGATRPAGLGLGPDPAYPNPDGGADDLDPA